MLVFQVSDTIKWYSKTASTCWRNVVTTVKPSTSEDVKSKKQHTEEKHMLMKPKMHIEDKPENQQLIM